MLVLGVRVRAGARHCHLLTLQNFGTIYTKYLPNFQAIPKSRERARETFD